MGKDMYGKALGPGLRQRPDGRYEGRIHLKGGGSRSIYSLNLKTCQLELAKLRINQEQLEQQEPCNMTLDMYFKDWIDYKQKAFKLKAGTASNYEQRYNKFISPKLGKKKINRITRQDVLNLQMFLLNHGSPRKLLPVTVNTYIILLSEIMDKAIKDGYIFRNPCNIEMVSREHSRETAVETIHKAMTTEQQKMFLSCLHGEWYEEYLTMLLISGMRMSEAAALQAEDIDKQNGSLHITKTLTRDRQGHVIVGNSPKTRSSKRNLPLSEQMEELIRRQQKKNTEAFGAEACIGKPIFLTPKGNLILSGTINKCVARVVERVNQRGCAMQRISVHALRDTFATRAIEYGMPPEILKAVMGHADIRMTLNLYAQVTEQRKNEEMLKIQRAFV